MNQRSLTGELDYGIGPDARARSTLNVQPGDPRVALEELELDHPHQRDPHAKTVVLMRQIAKLPAAAPVRILNSSFTWNAG